MDQTVAPAFSLADGPARLIFRAARQILWIVFACLLFFGVWREASAIYDVTEYILLPGEAALTANELAALNEKSETYVAGGLAPFPASVTAFVTGTKYTAEVVAADAHFPLFHQIRLLHGAWFSEDTPKAAVIDAALAVQMFLTEDAVGRFLTVNGWDLKIVGVYKANHSLFQQISLKTRAPVFVPFAARVPQSPAGPSYLYIKDQSENGTPVRVSYASILQLDDDTRGLFLKSYQDTEMHEKEWIVAQAGRILWFGAAYILAFYCLLVFYRTERCFLSWRAAQKAVFAPISGVNLGRRALLPALSALLALVLLVSAHFTPYIPDHFLTDNGRIFDLAHYFRYFAGEILSRRLYTAPQYYDQLFYNGMVLTLALSVFIWSKICRLASLCTRLVIGHKGGT